MIEAKTFEQVIRCMADDESLPAFKRRRLKKCLDDKSRRGRRAMKAAKERSLAAYEEKTGRVGKLGDGRFLDYVWTNRESILEFILKIFAIFLMV